MLTQIVLPVFCAALVAVYIGERALDGLARLIVSGGGASLFLITLVLATVRWRRASGARRQASGLMMCEYLLAAVALGLYAVQVPELGLVTAGEDLHTMLRVAGPALLMIAFLPIVAMELSIGGMRLTPRLEVWRVRLASRAARVVVLAAITFAGVNFAASTWDKKIDLSYFKTTQPGASTLALVRGLSAPVRFILFFPAGNEVAEQARSYLEPLVAESAQAKLQIVDQARHPDLARELKVRSNGYLAIESHGQTKTLHLGTDIETARAMLRDFDKELQQRLLEVVRPPRVAYLTTGHLERDYAATRDDKRLGLSDFRSLLETQGFTSKRLGLGEGLGDRVPPDATLVVVAGPLEPFLAAERRALQRYFDDGGSLIVAVDPEQGAMEAELLGALGLKVERKLVANARYLVRVQGRGESAYDLVTTRTSAHPTTKTLSDARGRLGVVLLGTGAIDKADGADATLKITMLLRSMDSSWLDNNGNGQLDDAAGEKEARFDLAAAIEREPPAAVDAAESATPPSGGRAVVLADADALGAGVVRTPGNAYFLLDVVRWLARDEAMAGTVESEADVAMVHRKDEDRLWFYGTSFAFPTLVLVAGWLSTRRGGRRRRRRQQGWSTTPP